MYSPINSGIYPDMVKTKEFSVIKKALKVFMPIVSIGCIFTLFISKYVLLIFGGRQYIEAANLLRALVPVLFFSFPAMLLGWPTLGAIGKAREVTITTIMTAVLQITGICFLAFIHQFELIQVALLRGATEMFMMCFRAFFCWKNRREFN